MLYMAIDTETRTSRRGLLAAALGGLGGLVLAKLGHPDPAAAANGDPVLVGAAHTGTSETSISTTTGPGLRGANTTDTPSTFSSSSYNTGLVGTAGATGAGGAIGEISSNTDETGVYGFSDVSPASVGVWGDTWQGIGVQGIGDFGVAGYGDAVGVYAEANSTNAFALMTAGKIRFNGRSGKTTITSGRIYRDVTIPGMTSSSYVIATLQTRKSGYSVECVVSYSGKFRVFLNRTATSTMYFSYLVIN
jgi:hypothetical protein